LIQATRVKKQREFVGLEKPPAIKTDTPGNKFVLNADRLGSYGAGSPVYNKGIEVGEVLQTEPNQDGKTIDVHIFVNAPHDKTVHRNSRFWDVSGINISLDANGMQIRTESLTSLLIGGIAFETPANLGDEPESAAGDRFLLYESREAIKETSYSTKLKFILYFENSVRGLKIGAPVEFRGIKVGSVVDVKLEFDAATSELRIPILIEVEPGRLTLKRAFRLNTLKVRS
jgi:paraquat-inducible protein B